MKEFMKSKTGTLHMVGSRFNGKVAAQCQSYNLDKLNPLIGEIYYDHTQHKKVCKKRLSHIK
jgi:hypothetical protein